MMLTRWLSAVVAKSFTDPAPNGQPYSYIIDLTGEVIPGRPTEVYIRNILDVSVLIARTSAAQLARLPGSIKAHIRYVAPFYEPPDIKKRYKESDGEGWKPRGLRGVWWHEAARAVGSVEGLPLVVLRTGLLYGESYAKYESKRRPKMCLPLSDHQLAPGLMLLGLVYKRLNQEMKLLWSPDLPKSSLHMDDFCGLVWSAAK